jgi:hypothetical protein
MVKVTNNRLANTWIAFPPGAYTDPQLWRAVVPEPGGILGVRVDENQ